MSQPEFLMWIEYFKLYPFDDFTRYFRPAALIAAMAIAPDGRQAAFEANLRLLQPDPTLADMTPEDLETMRAFGFTRKGD